MKLSDPEWYDLLQGNPLKVPTFTSELNARIRNQAQLSTVQKKVVQRSPKLHYITIIAVGMIAIWGMIFWGDFKPAVQLNDELGQNEFAIGVTDSKWLDVINQKYPDTANEILFKQTIGTESILIFNKKVYEFKGYQAISLGADLFIWESGEWKWQQNGSYSVDNDKIEDQAAKLITAWFGMQDTRMFFGMVIDPHISQIQVVDDQNIRQAAKIIQGGDGNNYWFIALAQKKNFYNVEALNAAGKILSKEAYYYN